MPRSLQPIPSDTAITNPKDGTITTFFRLAWETLRGSFQVSPDVASVSLTGQHAALGSTLLFTALTAGLYRVSYYLRKTVADGVSSSLTFTYGWTDSGTPLTEAEAALTLDTTSAEQSGSKLVNVDQASNLTFQVAYASNTGGAMHYSVFVVAELMS